MITMIAISSTLDTRQKKKTAPSEPTARKATPESAKPHCIHRYATSGHEYATTRMSVGAHWLNPYRGAEFAGAGESLPSTSEIPSGLTAKLISGGPNAKLHRWT
jgi:hypothetical protein